MISEAINQYPRNDLLVTTSMPGMLNSTTDQDQEIQALNFLRKKLIETSAIVYTILTFSLLFIVILVVVITTKLCSLKNKKRRVSSNDLDSRNTSESNKYNESIEIYEEPVWRDDQPSAIKVKPNAGYAKHTY